MPLKLPAAAMFLHCKDIAARVDSGHILAMDQQAKAAIIANDLDSLAHRIEDLGAHEEWTRALNSVTAAKIAVRQGAMDVHHREMNRRHGAKA